MRTARNLAPVFATDGTAGRRRRAAFALPLLLSLLVGCPLPSGPTANAPSPVEIIDDAFLQKPATGRNLARAPGEVMSVAGDDRETSLWAVFRLDVAVSDPSQLQARLSDLRQQSQRALHVIEPAAVRSDVLRVDDPSSWWGAIDKAQRDAVLAAGGGFERLPSGEADPALTLIHPFAFFLPVTELSAATRLSLFTRADAAGVPQQGDSLELVNEFFYQAAVGDSVVWGNGLREQDKFHSIVADRIERERNVKVIQQVWAYSGATISSIEPEIICTTNCNGEIPKFNTSIVRQLDLIENPEAVDLVLLNGCVNDVGLGAIFFNDSEPDELVGPIDAFCGDGMIELLTKAAATLPNADIVVTGYYPVLSEQSDPLGIQNWADATGQDFGDDLDEIKARLIRNGELFYERSTMKINEAIDAVNDASPNPGRITYAPVAWTPENAIFTPGEWLWGLTTEEIRGLDLDIELEVFPEDPRAVFRLSTCGEISLDPSYLFCAYSSVAHPNQDGAAAYAESIVNVLRERGVLPARGS